MSDKTEGTLVLDGLIEGKSRDLSGISDRLREWISAAMSLGLRFSLDIDGNSFSILADNKPIQTDDLAPEAAEKIAGALNELLKVFPAGERRQILSTLRSIEYRKDTEVQTAYAVGPDGKIHTRERVVDARTTPPPRQLTRKEKIRVVITGIVIAMLAFLASSVFVDYRALIGNVVETVTPLDAAEIKVETGGFKKYFVVEDKTISRGSKAVILKLKRTKAFPLKDSDMKQLFADAKDSVSERLTVEALARGYVRCEFFDKKDKFLGFTDKRISPLRKNETIELTLPVPRDSRTSRIVITY